MLLLILSTIYLFITTFNLTSKPKQLITNFISNKSKSQKELTSLQHERNEIYKQKTAISPQNEYAKWTKLNRKLDTIDAKLKTLGEQLATEKSTLSSSLNKLDWALKIPVFYWRFMKYKVVESKVFLWLPPSLAYWLSAKTGGISINLWLFFFGTVLYELRFIWESFTSEKLEKPIKSTKLEEIK